ncbi:MAG: hypothetical protein HOP12_00275, partial [Candidatus Eisenbacteria bacterium]|nr:hypothetical protein [Candidatus Eisenbacteria bacterium]
SLVVERAAQTLESCRLALADDPFADEAVRLQMRAFVSLGRRTEARRRFDAYAEFLRRELDAEPDTETVALARQLLSEA